MSTNIDTASTSDGRIEGDGSVRVYKREKRSRVIILSLDFA